MFVVLAVQLGWTRVYGPFVTRERASGEGLNRFGPVTFGAPVTWSVYRLEH
jgi:hypothetical protein